MPLHQHEHLSIRLGAVAFSSASAALLFSASALAQAVAPPQLPPPPPTFLHDALGLSDDFTLRGTFRPRFDALDGQFRPSPAARYDRLLSFQTTIFAEYRTGAFRFGGELFDSRTYLERQGSTIGTNEVNAVEPGQAYVGLNLSKAFARPGSGEVTAGRFTMDIGSRRLVARNQFRNTINTFTGVRYDWEGSNKDTLRVFYTLPDYRLPDETEAVRHNVVEPDRPSTDLQFFGGAYTKAGVLGGTLQLQSYGLIEKDSPDLATRNRSLFTPALRLARGSAAGKFDYDFEGIYQTGRARASTSVTDTTDLMVSAYFFHGEVGYTFDAPWKPRLALQYDHASGNRSNSSTYGRFDTLFGARRWEYGPTSLYGAVQRANLISPGLHLDVVPDKNWDGFIAYRPLFLESATDSFAATGVRDATGRSGTFAGQQVEARVRYWLIPKLARMDSGAAILFKGPFLRNAPNAPSTGDTVYGYTSVTFAF